jgi:hypothetical protein
MRHPIRVSCLAVLAFGIFSATALTQETHRHRPPAFPTFHSLEAVEIDAAQRLSSRAAFLKAQGPAGSNLVTYEGNVVNVFLSGSFGAVLMDANEFRFECDSAAYTLGCAYVTHGDHLLIYGHLRTYLSCRHDATDDEVVVNLVYRWTTTQCGDLTCTHWTLLSQ